MGGYSDNVLFIHIPKCGGYAVKEYCHEHLDGFVYPVGMHGARKDDGESGLPVGHVPLRDIERFTGRPLDSWDLIFATVRNPYHQQLSQWDFWRQRYAKGGRHLHDIVAAEHKDLESWLRDPRCDFHVWYEQHHGTPFRPVPPPKNSYEHYGSYYRYWLEVDGEMPGNLAIVKLEQVNEGVTELLQPYADHELPDVRPSNVTRSKRDDAMEFYTVAAALMVEQKFRWAFEAGLYPLWDMDGRRQELLAQLGAA